MIKKMASRLQRNTCQAHQALHRLFKVCLQSVHTMCLHCYKMLQTNSQIRFEDLRSDVTWHASSLQISPHVSAMTLSISEYLWVSLSLQPVNGSSLKTWGIAEKRILNLSLHGLIAVHPCCTALQSRLNLCWVLGPKVARWILWFWNHT